MKRLTKIYPSGAWGITGELDDAILRLAAYENTGLEPEEIVKIRYNNPPQKCKLRGWRMQIWTRRATHDRQ